VITIDLRGADKVFEHNRKFRAQVIGTVARSFGRGMRKTTASIRRDLQGLGAVRGITRSRWGRDARNRLSARVKTYGLRIRRATNLDADQEARMAIGLYGYAAVLEDGGRTVPHEIIMRTRRGTKAVRHPGSTLPGHGFGGSNLRRDESAIVSQLDRDVGELLARIYGV
jgi:hypothetical protein